MKLAELLAGLPDARVVGPRDVEVAELRDDSRAVTAGDVFVAVPGTVADGRRFLADAVARGASVLVMQGAPSVANGEALGGVPPDFRGTTVLVADARAALAALAVRRFPSTRSLTLTAVTGTNGKTTTTHLIEAMLDAAGIRAGVVGTIAYRVGAAPLASGDGGARSLFRPAPLTTPGAPALHGLFADMQAVGATDVVLEASSIALEQRRLDGCRFRVAGLTNITQDHLDYHGDMERYFDAKAILFERLLDPAAGVAVLPADREEGRRMRARVRGPTTMMVAAAPGTTGADVRVESFRMSAAGLRARLSTPAGTMEVSSPLVGDYNLANVVLAVGMGLGRGLPPDAIASGIERLQGVPGRLERVANDRGVLCVVDYAHTPDALERAQAAMRPLVADGGRLLTVFGCGGDRDRGKRPVMGQTAASGSDLVIVTSDNPRSEDPASIIAMIVEGVRRQAIPEVAVADLAQARAGYHVVSDRRTAIRRAVGAARAGDALLLAGKGHEDYQILGASKVHFDDREEARAAFSAMGRRA